MKYYLTLFLATSSLLLSSCTLCSRKKITCTAFEDSLFKQWFPYEKGQSLVFKNLSTADTAGYTIATVNFSEAYEISRGGIEGTYPTCESSAYITSTNENNSPFGIIGTGYTISEDGNKTLELWFNNGGFKTGAIGESSFAALADESNHADAVAPVQHFLFDNGITYPQVVIITNDTVYNKSDRPYKLYVAKHAGIIGCEMYPSLQKWIIQ